MIYVEITLDNVVCAKRCPRFVDNFGLIDIQAIREYFIGFGYNVGHIRIC